MNDCTYNASGAGVVVVPRQRVVLQQRLNVGMGTRVELWLKHALRSRLLSYGGLRIPVQRIRLAWGLHCNRLPLPRRRLRAAGGGRRHGLCWAGRIVECPYEADRSI